MAGLAVGLTSALFVVSAAQAVGFASAVFAGESGTVVSDGSTALFFNPGRGGRSLRALFKALCSWRKIPYSVF